MASNEEILNLNKPYGRNWEDFLLPDQMEFLHRAMDAARKDEVEAWMKFFYDPVNPFIEIENGRYCQSSGGSTTWSFDQLYTIFKKQNS